MKIQIKRIFKRETYTISNLFLIYDDKVIKLCDTLEDKVRIPFIKITGQTAIPAGTYKMILDYSYRFNKIMPHILDVPYFEGIRIHSGNTSEDTEGCILLGFNKEKGKVLNSKEALNSFKKSLYISKQTEWEIEII
jgi:hypothetical protein